MKNSHGEYEFRVLISGMFQATLIVRNGIVSGGPMSFAGFFGTPLHEVIIWCGKMDPDFSNKTVGAENNTSDFDWILGNE